MFNHKDARVLKLHAKGLPPTRIARKLGAPDDIARVLAALARAGLEPLDEVVESSTNTVTGNNEVEKCDETTSE